VVAAFDKQVAEPFHATRASLPLIKVVWFLWCYSVLWRGRVNSSVQRGGFGRARTPAEATLKRIKLGTNFAVFLLFFGVAALEAFQTRNWIKAAFWLAIGVVFLVADNLRKGR